MELKRADTALYEAGLAESRTKARSLILEGAALYGGAKIEKPSQPVDPKGGFSLAGEVSTDVSRAGQKLRAALEAFGLDVKGRVFADIGASTGGFTQCLLERGASAVFAVDVGHGQLHASLRSDPRVTVMEGVNARCLRQSDFGREIDGAVMDVSFISQTLIYPALSAILKAGAPLVTLVKPQFEAGRGNVGKNGVVRDKGGALQRLVMRRIELAAAENGFALQKTILSPVKGAKGNTEYLALLYRQ